MATSPRVNGMRVVNLSLSESESKSGITPSVDVRSAEFSALTAICLLLRSSILKIHVQNCSCCSEKAPRLFLKVNLSPFRHTSRWGTPGSPQLPHRARLPLLCLLCQGRPRPCSSSAPRACVFSRISLQARHTCFFTVLCGIITSLVAAAAAAAAVPHCTPATRGVFHTAAVLTINLYC